MASTHQPGFLPGQDPGQTGSARWVLTATILASSMAFIDSTALDIALPALQADLDASGKQLLWIVNAYLLLLSSLILAGGSLGDRFGRKRIFRLGILTFTAGSLAAGLAPTADWLIAFRAVQGAGGALMVPGSLALLSATVADHEQGRAIGTWAAFTTVTAILGPVLGGALASAGLWRVVFFINLPLAAGSLAILQRHVPESRDETAGRLDLAGMLLVTLALGSLTYGAIEAPEQGLRQPIVAGSLLLGVASLASFLWVERRAASPLVPLRLFSSPTFAGANLHTLLLYAALRAAFFFLGLTLIQTHGYPAQLAGLALVPFTLLLALLSRWSGDWVDRVGPRPPLVLGPGLTGVGFGLLALPGLGSTPANYWTTYLPGIVVMGIGMGITVAPLTTAVMTAVPRAQVGVASGVNNAVARTAGVLALAVLGGVALLSFRQTLVGSMHTFDLSEEQMLLLADEAREFGNAQPPAGLDPTTEAAIRQVIDHALLDTFRRTALLCAGLGLLSAGAGAVFIGAETRRQQDPARRRPGDR